ncbi:EcsC family protein [Myceligenerans xiligouense]|uniref:EcsC family protein n=1 Tax=Myceligenerans xiligouense TaxID=253184 RepID=UPI0014773BDB|nr:EcsC family protein [Myceligenerans xiligouense]
MGSAQSFLTRFSRIGLTPERVVKKHVAAGHDVAALGDVRALDLELVDKVRARNLDLGYAGAASASGAATALALTGGVIVAGSGAGAAPGALTVVGAIAADAAAILGITSRAVGHVALSYGYDPEDPSEKLIIRAVINVGAATTTATRAAALKDLSRLTQLLYRGASWSRLDASVIAKALTEFAKRFGVKFTKDTLGKVVPGVGIAVSATMNAATVESIVDEANRVYRRRFLKDKYPQLGAGELILRPTPAPETRDSGEAISIVEIVEDVLDDRDDDEDGVVA